MPRLAFGRLVASNLSGQTILLGRQRLGWARKIEIEGKKANLLTHYASMVTSSRFNVKQLTKLGEFVRAWPNIIRGNKVDRS
jgi:hypothetical protein